MSQMNSSWVFQQNEQLKKLMKCMLARKQFTIAWTLATIAEMGDHFHHDFQVGIPIDPHKYMGVNLGYITWAQQQARLQARTKQQAQGH